MELNSGFVSRLAWIVLEAKLPSVISEATRFIGMVGGFIRLFFTIHISSEAVGAGSGR